MPTYYTTLGGRIESGTEKHAVGSRIEVYNTADVTTNYERLAVYWTSNIATIGMEKGGSGTARTIRIMNSDGGGMSFLENGRVTAAGSAGSQWGITNSIDTVGMFFNGRITSGTSVPSLQLGNDTFGSSFSASSGTQKLLSVIAGRNQTSTAAFTGLEVNISGTGGSGSQRLLDLQESGTSRFYVEAGAPTSGNTVAFISYHNGAGVQLQRVSLGAADSGGVGFKVLRVPN